MASVLEASHLNIQFRMALLGDKGTKWIHSVSKLISINLTQMPDSFQWRLTTNGAFTVKSMYADLMDSRHIFRKNIFGKQRFLPRSKFSCGFAKGK